MTLKSNEGRQAPVTALTSAKKLQNVGSGRLKDEEKGKHQVSDCFWFQSQNRYTHTTTTPPPTHHTTPHTHHTHLHAGLPKIAAGLHEELFHSWSQERKMMALEPHLMTATVQGLEQFMPHHSLQRNGLIILGEEGEGSDKTGGKVSYPKSTAVTITVCCVPFCIPLASSQNRTHPQRARGGIRCTSGRSFLAPSLPKNFPM